jgi:hypothetical protein
MKRRKKSKQVRTLRLWDWAEVVKAAPYLRSVLGSLREHWLDVLNAERRLEKADQHAAPLKRPQLLQRQTFEQEHERAQVKFDDALEELNGLEVYLLDPVQGLALIPFRKGDELAWYIFDHFATDGVIGWRFHQDPIDECRPLDASDVIAKV